jgi:hypothetical protein
MEFYPFLCSGLPEFNAAAQLLKNLIGRNGFTAFQLLDALQEFGV